MKKLLAILAVTGIITGSSSTFISCNLKTKTDLSNLIIKEITGLTNKNTGQDVINKAIKKLSKASNLTEKKIKADKNLTFTLLKGSSDKKVLPKDNLDIVVIYSLIIKANNKDKYFTKSNQVKVIVKQNLEKIIIPTITGLTDKSSGNDVINKLIVKLANITCLTETQIKRNKNFHFEIISNEEPFFPFEKKLEVGDYTIKFFAKGNNPYFLTNSFSELQFSVKAFKKLYLPKLEDINNLKTVNNGNDVSERIFKEIARKSSLTLEQINSDSSNLIVTITDLSGNILEKQMLLKAGKYYLTIGSTFTNKYFNPGSRKINLNVIDYQKQDLPTLLPDITYLTPFNIGMDAIKDSQDEIAARTGLTINEILSDPGISFILINSIDSSKQILSDSLFSGEYTIKININNSKYFNDSIGNVNVIVSKINLPLWPTTIQLPNYSTGKAVYEIAQNKLAEEVGATINQILDDENLKFRLTDSHGIVIEEFALLDSVSNYFLFINANDKDKYFHKGETKIIFSIY